MNYLIACPCGHTLDRHLDGGCFGDRRGPCRCRLMLAEALDAAIDLQRSALWANRHGDDQSVDRRNAQPDAPRLAQ